MESLHLVLQEESTAKMVIEWKEWEHGVEDEIPWKIMHAWMP